MLEDMSKTDGDISLGIGGGHSAQGGKKRQRIASCGDGRKLLCEELFVEARDGHLGANQSESEVSSGKKQGILCTFAIDCAVCFFGIGRPHDVQEGYGIDEIDNPYGIDCEAVIGERIEELGTVAGVPIEQRVCDEAPKCEPVPRGAASFFSEVDTDFANEGCDKREKQERVCEAAVIFELIPIVKKEDIDIGEPTAKTAKKEG